MENSRMRVASADGALVYVPASISSLAALYSIEEPTKTFLDVRKLIQSGTRGGSAYNESGYGRRRGFDHGSTEVGRWHGRRGSLVLVSSFRSLRLRLARRRRRVYRNGF